MMQRVREDNKNIVRAWETREWEKAAARIKAAEARIKAQEAAGIKDPVKEYSKQLVAAREAGELTEQRVGQRLRRRQSAASIRPLHRLRRQRRPRLLQTLRIIPLSATAVTVELKLDLQPLLSSSPLRRLERHPHPSRPSCAVGRVHLRAPAVLAMSSSTAGRCTTITTAGSMRWRRPTRLRTRARCCAI